MSTLDSNLLATFSSVLEAGRISAAARSLHLSQPAVTAQIRRLEDALGVALFVRSATGVTPTAAGRRLAEHARLVQSTLARAVADVATTAEPQGALEIAASTTIAAHVLPQLLARFRGAHPEVPLHVRVDNTEAVVRAVRAGELPLGLVEGHARASGIRLEPYLDDELVPIVGRDARFTVRRLRDLDSTPILWREAGSGTRAVVERALREAGVKRRGRLDVELGSTDAILGAAVAGLGVAFVSRWSVRTHLALGLVRLIPGLELPLKRTFRWALPAGSLGGTAARFYELARSTPVT